MSSQRHLNGHASLEHHFQLIGVYIYFLKEADCFIIPKAGHGKEGSQPAGFKEALMLMPVGSEWEIYIPQNLAYGEQDMGTIKPYSTLIFKLQLLGIEKYVPTKTVHKRVFEK